MQDQVYFSLIMFFPSVLFDALLKQLPSAMASEKVVWTSTLLANFDYIIFKKDILFWIDNFVNTTGGTALSWTLLQFYNSLPFVVAFFVLALFLYHKLLAKKFLVFFFTILFISFPIWYILPGMNPMNFYIDNILHTNPPSRISMELQSYNPNPIISSYHKEFIDLYQKDHFLDVNAFPSMHAGYSVGMIIYGFLLWPPSVLITVPWFLVEMLGALYTGQHYLIDLFLGSLMAIVTYYVVEILFFIEKKYYTGPGSLFIIDTMQKDIWWLFNRVKGILIWRGKK